MKISRMVVIGTFLLASLASAQDYPSRPIKIVVPYATGGGTDFLARLLATELSERLRQPVLIDNRPGASTFIGAELVARSAPDGYTLLTSAASTFAINQSLFKKLPYDPSNDFAPITLLGQFPLLLVVSKDYSAKSLQEFVNGAKTKAGGVDFASAGTGSTHHLAMEAFMQRTGVKMVHVPYKGAGPALTDIIAGRVPSMLLDIAVAREPIRAGQIRALGVATAKRLDDLPDVPTIAEGGYPSFEVSAWNGMVAPRGTPPAIIDRLNQEIGRVLNSPAIRPKLRAAGIEPAHNTPAEFAAYIKAETERWGEVVRRGNVTVDQPK
jgi:tripartite-type tricarboxylate transporter receptor subunit TctC